MHFAKGDPHACNLPSPVAVGVVYVHRSGRRRLCPRKRNVLRSRTSVGDQPLYSHRLPDSRFCATWRKKVEEVVDQYDPDVVYFDSRSMIIREEDRYRVAEYYDRKTGADRGVITYKQERFS